jgi:hypothetical protein
MLKPVRDPNVSRLGRALFSQLMSYVKAGEGLKHQLPLYYNKNYNKENCVKAWSQESTQPMRELISFRPGIHLKTYCIMFTQAALYRTILRLGEQALRRSTHCYEQ